MRKIANVVEVEGEGLEALLEQRVTLYCMNYIYTGRLVGVNSTFVKLEDAEIVYETGAFAEKGWRTSEKFPNAWYVQTASIESFGLLK
jgi:hypothetical protein